MVNFNVSSKYFLDSLDYLDFFLESAILFLLLALIVIIYYGMRRNRLFYEGAGPWLFVAVILLVIPVFFDVFHDFLRSFTPNGTELGADDLLKDVDLILFLVGALLGVYGCYRQFLHSKSLDAQLRYHLEEGERSIKDLAELLPQTVFELDTKGNIVYANPKGLETFGYTLEELKRGLNVSKLFIPEDLARIGKNIRKILKGELFEDHEYTAIHKDGKSFPVLIYSNSIIKDNERVGLRGVILDISDI